MTGISSFMDVVWNKTDELVCDISSVNAIERRKKELGLRCSRHVIIVGVAIAGRSS
jgi:hypothetical protein